jgi:hypothetical protein
MRSLSIIPLASLLILLSACREKDMGWPRPAFAPNVEYGPQIAMSTPEALTVHWRTRAPVLGEVEARVVGSTEWIRYSADGYSTAGDSDAGDSDGGATVKVGLDHAARLTGLEEGKTYEYRLLHNGRVISKTMEIAPRGIDSTRFVVIGDSGAGSKEQYAVARRIAAIDPEFVLHTGDLAYDHGTRIEGIRRYFVPFAESVATRPWYIAWGNHDVMSPSGGATLRKLFRLPGTRYYSFDWGDARIYCLDTNVEFGSGSAQHDWFRADLESCRRRWKIVVFHHPPYSGSPYARSFPKRSASVRRELCPLFEQHGVQFVFNGHVHGYERAEPTKGGPVYIVTGGGGKRLNKPGTASWTKVYSAQWHVCEVTLGEKGAQLRALDTEGNLIDSYPPPQDG